MVSPGCKLAFHVEAARAGHGLQQDPHPVGGIGDLGWHAHDHQCRERQHGATAGNGVHEAGGYAGNDQQDQMKGINVHGVGTGIGKWEHMVGDEIQDGKLYKVWL